MGERNDPFVIERLELSSGLEVVRQPPPPGARSVALSYVGPAGWAFDPEGREGAAVVTTHLSTVAAGRRNRVELARELDRLGATLTGRPAPESSELTIWGPAAAWTDLLGLLADAVLRPRFDADDVARVRRQLAERQLRELTQPDGRVEREFLRRLFPTRHPYRETGLGTGSSLTRLGRESLRRFHHDHTLADGAHLVATAPASLPTIRREVERRFRDLSTRTAPAHPPVATHPPRRDSLTSVDLPGRTQVEVRVGGPSLPRSAPEFPALFLADQLLGGRPLLNRLFQLVRERHGLAYHASSDLEAMRWGGYFYAEAGTGPERADRVIEFLRAQVARLSEETASVAELDRIRESAIGELPLEIETSSGAHELAVDVAYHHLPDDFHRQWPQLLRSLRPADVRRAAEVGLDAASAVTIRAGPR